MIPNIHIHEKLMLERHQQVLREMEQRRILKGVQRQPFRMPRQLVGKLGVFLITLGTSLQRFEPSRESIG